MNIDVKVLFVENDDVQTKHIYSVNVTEITNNTIQCSLNFNNSILVSQGYEPDFLLFEVNNHDLFYSLDTNEPIKKFTKPAKLNIPI